MKNVVLAVALAVSGVVTGQDFNSQDFYYKQLSPYWRTVKLENGTNTMVPFQAFNIRNTYYKDNVDTSLVKELIYNEFKQFRNDYNVKECTKSNKLHVSAQYWAYEMKQNGFRHSKGLCNGENISSINIIQYTCIYAEQGDINRIVARSLLDSFVKSKAHMDSLLSTEFKEVGIGIVFFRDQIYIVVQLNN